MVVQYKCPSCGSDLTFDSATGQLKCQNCGNTIKIEDMPKEDYTEKDPANETECFNPEDIADEANYDFDEEYQEHPTYANTDVHEFTCKNCGAKIIAESDTIATSCSFCGAPVVLSERVSNEYAPSKVIPFKISKQQAQEKFSKWCKRAKFIPTEFQRSERVKSITGMYVPFWLYDVNAKGEVDAICTRTRSYTRGDYDYIETSYFHVYRKINLNYNKIPVDASEKMNDALMDRIEPFNYNDIKQFEMPYLSGYLAEKYNYDAKQCYPRAKERIDQYVDSYIQSTMTGYTTTRYNRKDVNTKQRNSYYSLFPVWMVYYDWHDSEHVFMMNGQTGKIVGKPPVAKNKVLAWFGGISAASFVVLKIVGLILGGNIL